MRRCIYVWGVMFFLAGGMFISFPSLALAVDCVGATSGNAGECATLARCDGNAENATQSVCKDEQICCVLPDALPPGTKPPKEVDPPVTPDPGNNPGVGGACAGGNGTCRTSGTCSNPQPGNTECGGGMVCCGDGGPSSGGGQSDCAAAGGSCRTVGFGCMPTETSSTRSCGSGSGTEARVCCMGSSTGGTSTSTGAVTAGACPSNDYEKIAGVCFPKKSVTGLSDKSIPQIISAFLGWLLAIFGFIALIGFVISGMQYLLSTGDEGMAETAKRNMKYCIIGIIVALSGWIIIKAVDALLNASSFI